MKSYTDIEQSKKLAEILPTEQKAKRYDEAINIAKSKIKNNKDHVLYEDDIIEMFPELKKKTDEEMIQKLIAVCHLYYGEGVDAERDECLEWLEKQRKNKPIERKEFTSIPFGAFDSELIEEMFTIPDGCVATIEGNRIHIKREYKTAIEAIKKENSDNANKVKYKFKVGDWITNGATKPAQISSIEDDMYYTHNGTIGGNIESMDKDYHLWTITYAKDGDILISSDNKPFIFNGWIDEFNVGAYCGLNIVNEFTISNSRCNWTSNKNIKPATEKQCQTLFDKMKLLGWVWNPETKKLNRLNENEQNNN